MTDRSAEYYETRLWCYTDKLSYQSGESIGIRVSNPGGKYTCRLTRIGANELVVFEQAETAGESYALEPLAYKEGCSWSVAFEIVVNNAWPSGYYRLQLIGERSTAEHFIVIRNVSSKPAPFVLVLATNTYHAYNSWGGKNLYGTDISVLDNPALDMYGEPSPIISTQRPFAPWIVATPRPMRTPSKDRREACEGSKPAEAAHSFQPEDDFCVWDLGAGYLNKWEHMFVRWAEANGYALDFLAQEDLQRAPEILSRNSCLISVGHDEYWSWQGRDAVENFIDCGGKAAFFSGNACYWQVRFQNDLRQMVGYKYAAHLHDPVMGTKDEKRMTGIWADPAIGRPETIMKGTTFTRAGYSRVGLCMGARPAGFTVTNEDHWSLKNTNMFYGDMFGDAAAVAGYEVDGCAYQMRDGLPVPTGEDGADTDMEIVAMAPASLGEYENTQLEKGLGHKDASIFAERILGADTPANRSRARRGAAALVSFIKGKGEVFSASATEWAWGLELGDEPTQQITKNVLNRFGV